MNCQLSTTKGGSPVIGVWDDTENNWVARVNDNFSTVNTYKGPPLQTYALITSIPMKASHRYSFRVTGNYVITINAESIGSTGEDPVSQISLKRLK